MRALAVDNEPVPFWDGSDEPERVARWVAEFFSPDCGTATTSDL